MLNTLLVLYVIFFSNMGIAIVVFTVMVRLATLPLTLKQLRQMRGMTTMQPKVKEIQERYSGRAGESVLRDRRRRVPHPGM